jgi:hypothetical protein
MKRKQIIGFIIILVLAGFWGVTPGMMLAADRLPSIPLTLQQGVYTILQKSNGRFVDAHVTSGRDFSLVTRTVQNNDTQRWILKPVGGVYTIRQKSTGRFVDAHVTGERDFSLVTRTAQNNDTQRWILTHLGNDTYTIQHKSSGRFVDAHVTSERDFSLVTRRAQNNNTQRWLIKRL